MQQPRPNIRIWGAVVGGLAVLILGGIIWGALASSSSLPLAPATQTGIPTPPNSSATPDQRATEAQATQDAIATIAKGREIDAITAVFELTASPPPTIVFSPGIYDDQGMKDEWARFGFNVQNAWFGLYDNNLVSIWAGAPMADPDQGSIQVQYRFPHRVFEQNIPAPTRGGALLIAGEQNLRLTLLSTDGTTFYFDVPAIQFVTSLTETVPTATALPTSTPLYPPTMPPSTAYPGLPTEAYPAPTTQPTAAP